MDTFNFCPNSLVPKILPPDPTSVVSMNGWQATSKPSIPYQKRFSVMLHGLRWYTNKTTGLFDTATNPTVNARVLEMFYEAHQNWDPFLWTHPHLGQLTCRFNTAVQIPPGKENSGGFIDAFEIQLIHHNPSF